MMGMNLGVLVGVGIFVTLIQELNLDSNFKIIFLVPGMLVVAFSVITPFMIIEPPDLKKKKLLQKKRQE